MLSDAQIDSRKWKAWNSVDLNHVLPSNKDKEMYTD